MYADVGELRSKVQPKFRLGFPQFFQQIFAITSPLYFPFLRRCFYSSVIPQTFPRRAANTRSIERRAF